MSILEIIIVAIVISAVFSFTILMMANHYYRKQINRLDNRIDLLENALDQVTFKYNKHIDRSH